MTPAEREAIFRRARARIVRDQAGLIRGTDAELARLLQEANRAVKALLAAQPSDYALWSLPRLSAEIRGALEEFRERGAARVSTGVGRAWALGEELVDAPIDATGLRISAVLPRIDTQQLTGMRSFMVERIKDVGIEAANKITAELGLVVIGARAPSEAIGLVSQILGGGSRERARTIVRTELGRAFSFAAQKRLEAAAERLPGLKKQWRRSGKAHPRLHHDLADGQVQDVDKPFVLRPFGRPAVELMYPRDPAAPASETINCGCIAIPYMESWKDAKLISAPGRKPGSELLENDGETLADVLERQDRKVRANA